MPRERRLVVAVSLRWRPDQARGVRASSVGRGGTVCLQELVTDACQRARQLVVHTEDLERECWSAGAGGCR
jgi:hypothetical protein